MVNLQQTKYYNRVLSRARQTGVHGPIPSIIWSPKGDEHGPKQIGMLIKAYFQ